MYFLFGSALHLLFASKLRHPIVISTIVKIVTTMAKDQRSSSLILRVQLEVPLNLLSKVFSSAARLNGHAWPGRLITRVRRHLCVFDCLNVLFREVGVIASTILIVHVRMLHREMPIEGSAAWPRTLLQSTILPTHLCGTISQIGSRPLGCVRVCDGCISHHPSFVERRLSFVVRSSSCVVRR